MMQETSETQTASSHEANLFAANWLSPDNKSGRSHNEKAHAQSYWREFFSTVMGIRDLYDYGVRFEYRIKNTQTGAPNWIDVFIPGVVLIEHKSAGKDLALAESQARSYMESLPRELRPDWIIVCDFVNWSVINYISGEKHTFTVDALPSKLGLIEQILSESSADITLLQMEWDRKAADLISNVHREMIKSNYDKHSANILIARLLFLMFADDLQIFSYEPLFDRLVAESKEDGSDLGGMLTNLFRVVNQPHSQRSTNIPELIAKFPHIGGELFAEPLPPIFFNADLRNAILTATRYEWSSVNPIVMGSLYQQIKTAEERHSGGEHFTSEKNAYRALRGLMLDELYERKEQAWNDTGKLEKLRRRLGEIKLADFACGSGNLLAVGYRELRNMEIDIIARIKQMRGTYGNVGLISDTDIYVTLDQVYGVEIEEYSALLARVSLFLVDALMNKELEMITGIIPTTFPLEHTANIVCGNALQVDWKEVCPPGDNVRLVMNPPFLGSSRMSKEQKEDQQKIWGKSKGGAMDFVSNWFLLAGRYIQGTKAQASIVSSNSISQGTQPAVLWAELYKLGISIDFAYRSFKWGNGGAGKAAAVHVVIIGLTAEESGNKKSLYYFNSQDDNPIERLVSNINGYLVPAENLLLDTRSDHISGLPNMIEGSKPTDGGFLTKIDQEALNFIKASDLIALKYIKQYLGADELLYSTERYCLWLEGASPNDVRSSDFIKDRIAKVKDFRSSSTDKTTRKDADTPHLFQAIRQPKTDYVAVPKVISENREYIPLGFIGAEVIASNRLAFIPRGDRSIFAVLSSKNFTTWVDAVSGRLESRYSVSNTMVYNNFPFPDLTDDQKAALEVSGQTILDARANYPSSSLADLYDPLAMPIELRKAHRDNDKLVLSIYGLKADATYDEIINELFRRYKELTEQ
jgi:hypothetical protein